MRKSTAERGIKTKFGKENENMYANIIAPQNIFL
jgi:hypothetical protein